MTVKCGSPDQVREVSVEGVRSLLVERGCFLQLVLETLMEIVKCVG